MDRTRFKVRKSPPSRRPEDDAHTQAEDVRSLRAARDDLAQFAPVYERYVDRIYAYCRTRVGTPDAEDVTSQVFMRALAGVDGFRGGSVAAWLFRIAHNGVVDHLRGQRTTVPLDALEWSLLDTASDVLDQIAHADDVRRVRRLIAELSDEQANLLALKLAGGLNAKEIAAAVGKTHVAVRVELHRIINRLRAAYHAEIGEVDA